MQKAELISEIAKRAVMSKKDCGAVLNALTEIIKETLIAGDKVRISGFGTFEAGERSARNGINPKTMEPLYIEACKFPKFRPGNEFKASLKE